MATVTSMPVYMSPGVATIHPSHLDGDPTLATEILPGPPSVASVQQSIHKRDPRKPGFIHSYLPVADPGTTYSGPPALVGAPSMETTALDGPRPKRARIDKGRVNRAQRSTRLSTSLASALPPYNAQSPGQGALTCDHDLSLAEEDLNMPLSGSLNISCSSRPSRRKDKGKGKEVDTGVKVKEEPKAVSLLSPEPPLSLANEDHCSACRSYGALVYCDGCPRAFHFLCLDPPMEAVDIPSGDSRWFCPSCMIRKHPPSKPPPSLLSPLLHHIQTTIPTEYQLPEDIRSFFKDVTSAANGVYVDGSEIKQPRLNRFGQVDEREITKLKDRNGEPVLCFQCGKSALPSSIATSKRIRRSAAKPVQTESWNNIISCDYCDLHWHLDCLDPPPATLPPLNRKWMCPNHIEHISNATLRVPKANVPSMDISKPGQFNNGNIEVILPQLASASQNKVAAEELMINGRRYRVPERIIVLDFWGRLGRSAGIDTSPEFLEVESGMSSPLTSLSSLEDIGILNPQSSATKHEDANTFKAAEILCNLRHSATTRVAAPKKMMVRGTQTDPSDFLLQPLVSASVAATAPPQNRKPNGAAKRKARGSAKPAPASRRVKATPVEPSNRELRSSRRKNAPLTNGHVHVKMEEVDDDTGISTFRQFSGAAVSKSPTKSLPESAFSTIVLNSPSRDKPKRGRKRKAVDDDEVSDATSLDAPKTLDKDIKHEKDKRIFVRTPNRLGQHASVSAPLQSGGQSATPTLKIRLPRLIPSSPLKAITTTADTKE